MRPSTSVQISTRSAPSAAPRRAAVKSEPPRPSVVGTPSGVAPMNPWVTGISAALEQRPEALARAVVDHLDVRGRAAEAVVGHHDRPDVDPGRREARALHRRRDEARAPQLAGAASSSSSAGRSRRPSAATSVECSAVVFRRTASNASLRAGQLQRDRLVARAAGRRWRRRAPSRLPGEPSRRARAARR